MKTAVLIGLSRHRIGVDGAGVTTLVAFHGCPLNCKYCLNPQALSPKGVWKRYTPDELFRVVSKDDLYFRASELQAVELPLAVANLYFLARRSFISISYAWTMVNIGRLTLRHL